MKKLLVLGLTVWLTACSTHYLKPGQPDLTRQDFDRDYADCIHQVAPNFFLWLPVALGSVGRLVEK
jgi:hypothetical protein